MTNRAALNQVTAHSLDDMELSSYARGIIAATDINLMFELFGSCKTAADVEELCRDLYGDDTEGTTAFVVIRHDYYENEMFAGRNNQYTILASNIRFWNTREEAQAFADVDEMNMCTELGQWLSVKEVKVK